jgi:hypothetical protein
MMHDMPCFRIVDEVFALYRIAARVPSCGDRLVAGPGQREDRDKSDQCGQTAADPA